MFHPSRKIAFRAIDWSLLLAAIGTAAYYAVILTPEMRETMLARYTADHPVEYAIVALFIWGIVDITFKLLKLPAEIVATRQQWLTPRTGRVPVEEAATLLEEVRAHPAWSVNTRMGRRFIEALSFVRDKGSADEFSEHLRYLADQDHNESQSRYTLIRFVIAVTPILGFLGTVVHFGTALGGFSIGNADKQLTSVVSEMGTAFNTTSAALAAAMIMIFALFLCERVDRSLLSTTDRLVDCELLNRFEVQTANLEPAIVSIKSIHEAAIEVIASTLQRQVELWARSLQSVFDRFEERQQCEIAGWRNALDAANEQHTALDERREEWLGNVVAHVDEHLAASMRQLAVSIEPALSLRESIGALTETLNNIASGQGHLVQLQSSLSNNLQILHETQQFDAALHGLTAAIHLLTARAGNVSAPELRAKAA